MQVEAQEAMREALAELVAIEDLRIRAGKISPVEPGCEKEVLGDEYRRRLPIAWHRARAALSLNPPLSLDAGAAQPSIDKPAEPSAPTLEQFIAALQAFGWRAHADAQHERIAELHAHLWATP